MASYRSPSWTLLLASSLIHVQPCLGRSYDQFQQFFPAWSGIVQDIITANCSDVLKQYLDRNDPDTQVPYHLLGCIMENFPEFRKAELAAASVALGLIPVTLQAVSVSTTEISILSLRRPLLAFLMAGGCPVLVPLRSRMYKEAIDVIGKPAEVSMKIGGIDDPPLPLKAVISTVEYLVVLACAANIAVLVWQLSVWAVTVFAPRDIFMPSLWVYLAMAVHFGGVVALRLRVTPPPSPKESHGPIGAWNKGWAWTKAWAISEVTPCVYGKPLSIDFRPSNTTIRYLFFVFSWATFCGANMHVLLGIIVLSSSVFISEADTIGIIGRFVASAVFCRLVVMYELSGLREVTSGIAEVEQPIRPKGTGGALHEMGDVTAPRTRLTV